MASTRAASRAPAHSLPLVRLISLLVVAAAVVARVLLYLEGKFFWLDESYLYLALRDSDWLSVALQKNLYNQSYPAGFGLISWLAIQVFPDNAGAVRFFPLLCGCASVVMLYRVCRACAPDKVGLLALLLYGCSIMQLFYSFEFKQYSCETLITCVLLHAYLRCPPQETLSWGVMALFCLCLLFSYPAAFVLCAFVAGFFWRRYPWRRGQGLAQLGKNGWCFAREHMWKFLCVGLFALAYFAVSVQNGTANNGGFWNADLMPHNPLDVPQWLWRRALPMVSLAFSFVPYKGYGLPFGGIVLGLSLVGLAHWRREGHPLLPLALTLMAVQFLGALVYPFGSAGNMSVIGTRLSMYAVPVIALAAAFGLFRLLELCGRRVAWAYALTCACLLCLCAVAVAHVYRIPPCDTDARALERHVTRLAGQGKRVLACNSSWYSLHTCSLFLHKDLDANMVGENRVGTLVVPPQTALAREELVPHVRARARAGEADIPLFVINHQAPSYLDLLTAHKVPFKRESLGELQILWLYPGAARP